MARRVPAAVAGSGGRRGDGTATRTPGSWITRLTRSRSGSAAHARHLVPAEVPCPADPKVTGGERRVGGRVKRTWREAAYRSSRRDQREASVGERVRHRSPAAQHVQRTALASVDVRWGEPDRHLCMGTGGRQVARHLPQDAAIAAGRPRPWSGCEPEVPNLAAEFICANSTSRTSTSRGPARPDTRAPPRSSWTYTEPPAKNRRFRLWSVAAAAVRQGAGGLGPSGIPADPGRTGPQRTGPRGTARSPVGFPATSAAGGQAAGRGMAVSAWAARVSRPPVDGHTVVGPRPDSSRACSHAWPV